MSFSYDPTTDLGAVRLIIGDSDATNIMFQDNEVQTFLNLTQANVYRAAALAIDTIATNQAMTLKVMSLLDLHTDGATLAKALRDHAVQLREQANISDAANGVLFDYAEQVDNIFTLRERVLKQAQRRLY